MSVVTELILTENDGSLSFGNHELSAKAKMDNYEAAGDLYKVKTYCDITKLEKNGLFVYESVPGTAVNNLLVTDKGMTFTVEGNEATQITVELEPGEDYKVFTDNVQTGYMQTNMSGKLAMSVELNAGSAADVRIEKGS